MSDLHLVTGYAGEAHITAVDHGSLIAAIFGTGDYVLNRGNKLSASYIGNNTVRVLDGDLLIQGRHIRLDAGAYCDLTVSSISSSYKRSVLICAKYTKSSTTGVETCSLTTLTGTMTTGTPQDPSFTTGDVLTGAATTHYFPLYRVLVSGATIGDPEQMFDMIDVVRVGADGVISSDNLPDMSYIPTAQKGAADGVAPLNSSKKIDSTYLPLSSAIDSESTDTAATSKAVHDAYTAAAGYSLSTVSGTDFTGFVYRCGRLVIVNLDIEASASWVTKNITVGVARPPAFSDSFAAPVYTGADDNAQALVTTTRNSGSISVAVTKSTSGQNTATVTFSYIAMEE